MCKVMEIFFEVSLKSYWKDNVKKGDVTAVSPGSPDLDPKWARLAPNGTNLELFQIRFQYILARRAKMY